MDPIVRDILRNKIARKNGEDLKTIKINELQISEIFYKPFFEIGNKLDKDLATLIFDKPYSLMRLTYETLEAATGELREELENHEDAYDFDFDTYHFISKGVEYWADGLYCRYEKKFGVDYEYDSIEELIQKYGWNSVITEKDDIEFENAFLEIYKTIMDDKKEQLKSLQKQIYEFDALVSRM